MRKREMNFNFTIPGITTPNDYKIDCNHEHQTRERFCHTELSMRKHKTSPYNDWSVFDDARAVGKLFFIDH